MGTAKDSLLREKQGACEVLRDQRQYQGSQSQGTSVKGPGRGPKRKVMDEAISPSPVPWAHRLATFELSHAVRRCPALLTVAVPAAVTDLEVQSKQ